MRTGSSDASAAGSGAPDPAAAPGTGPAEPGGAERGGAGPAGTVPAGTEPPSRVRRWSLLAVVAAGAVLLMLLTLFVVRLITSNAHPPLGPTAVEQLQPGSCLAEADPTLAQYTVVDCGQPHPLQVIAAVDLSLGSDAFSSHDAMPALAQLVCDRYLEYDLFVSQEPGEDRLAMVAIGVPSAAEWDAGRTTALCAVTSTDGSPLTGDEFRPIR